MNDNSKRVFNYFLQPVLLNLSIIVVNSGFLFNWTDYRYKQKACLYVQDTKMSTTLHILFSVIILFVLFLDKLSIIHTRVTTLITLPANGSRKNLPLQYKSAP